MVALSFSFSFTPSFSSFIPLNSSSTSTTRIMVSVHQSLPPLSEDLTVVGCGGASMDYLLMVDGFPRPDEKIQGSTSKVQGGGNVGNALTCAARLGIRPRIITKVAENTEGRSIVEELEADGVDTSYTVVSDEGRSMYSYVIVDSKMKSRTAIYYPGNPPMVPADFSSKILSSALDRARLVYFDGLSLETALVLAEKACHKNIPILVDAEMGEEGFDDLLNMADYAVCSAKYPQAWTKAPSMPSALVSMLTRLPKLKFVIVTHGEEGCIMLQRSQNGEKTLESVLTVRPIDMVLLLCAIGYLIEFLSAVDDAHLEEMNVDQCLASLNQRKDRDTTYPTCVSSPVLKLEAPSLGVVVGKLLVGTAERIPDLELVDTTGAGDAFIGAVLYALCTDMLPEKMLPFAAQVAAGCCRAFGARTGLPHRTDPRLQCFLDDPKGSMASPNS